VNEEGKGGRKWSTYFLYMCEYATLRPAEVILRREGEEGE
jgi:hypothetical protein